MQRLTHISDDGRAQMVDVSAKPVSKRKAVAIGKIRLRHKTLDLISKDQIAKGNVFATARIAGIQAAKQTAHLIPLCHTLPLGEVKIDIVTSNEGAEPDDVSASSLAARSFRTISPFTTVQRMSMADAERS